MGYKLSNKSLSKLENVNPKLVAVVKRAIEISKIDFAVTEGVRTVARQKQLVAAGASKTMESKHINGNAVDLVAYIGTRISWELNLYDDLADAMAQAARELDVNIRWGGAWHISDIAAWNSSMQSAMDNYIDTRRKQGKRPFIDGPHFELM